VNKLVDAFDAFDANKYSRALGLFLSLVNGDDLSLDERVNIYNNLGYIYEMGLVGSADFIKAAIWYEKAAELNDACAQFSLAELQRSNFKDYKNAMAWYHKAANQKYSPALCQLGFAYSLGDIVKKDVDKGKRYFHEAANLGHYISRAEIARNSLYGKYGIKGIFHGLFSLFYLPISAHLAMKKNPHDERLKY